MQTVRETLNQVETRAQIITPLCHAITEAATGRADDAREALNECGFLLMALEDQARALETEVEAAQDAETARSR